MISNARWPAAVALAALLAALPVAGAGWSVQGSFEPDTPDDVRDGRMWLEPDTNPDPAAVRIYFNAFLVSSAQPDGQNVQSSTGARVNPNALPLGSRLAPGPGPVDALAFLGVWKDCDGDGYVGHAASAMLEYRRELLPDETVCPDGGDFHRNGWVWEFHWIGSHTRHAGSYDGRRSVVVDPVASVWGDFGRPGGAPFVDCSEYPLPPGTTSSTGGALAYADCEAGYAIATGVNSLDEDGSKGLRFDDPRHPERDCGSALNRRLDVYPHPWECPSDDAAALETGSGDPAFEVWDCDRPRGTADVRDPTAPPGERGELSAVGVHEEGVVSTPVRPIPYRIHEDVHLASEEGSYATLPAPAPALRSPSGSYHDAVDHARRGFDACSQTPQTTLANETETAGVVDFLRPGLWLEKSRAGVAASDGKRETDFAFNFTDPGTQPNPYLPLLRWTGDVAPGSDRAMGDANRELGIHALHTLDGQGWRSYGIVRTPPGYMGGTVRSDLAPAEPVWATFYARVGERSTAVGALPTAAAARYGSEACGVATGGIVGGWDCDPANWWRADLGVRQPPPAVQRHAPGDAYHLRDVDCLDGTIHPLLPAKLSLAALSGETSCPHLPPEASP